MLEEFFRDKAIVDSFAKNYKTGEVLPDELFTKMLRADAFGRGMGYERQIAFANYSLELHDRAPDKVDIEGMWKQMSIEGSPWQWGGWESWIRNLHTLDGLFVELLYVFVEQGDCAGLLQPIR